MRKLLFFIFKWCPETELNRRHADFQSVTVTVVAVGKRERREVYKAVAARPGKQ